MQLNDAFREANKELVLKYIREVQLRKSYHDQLVELRGEDLHMSFIRIHMYVYVCSYKCVHGRERERDYSEHKPVLLLVGALILM